MEIMKIHLGMRWEITPLGTEFAPYFCAGIGPLQLAAVFVYYVVIVV